MKMNSETAMAELTFEQMCEIEGGNFWLHYLLAKLIDSYWAYAQNPFPVGAAPVPTENPMHPYTDPCL